MLDDLTNASGAVLVVRLEDGSTRLQAFGDDNRLFAGALLGIQRMVKEHFKLEDGRD
jgi:hypothetical protein